MTPTPPPPAEPPAGLDLQAVLDALPAPVLVLDDRGRLQWANRAAQRHGGPLPDGDMPVGAWLGWPSDQAPAQPVQQRGTDVWWQWRPFELPDGRRGLMAELATDLVRSDQALHYQNELLDVAQDFGRLGVWQRHVRTLVGRWDRHVYKFWGLDPDDGAPSFETATQQIVDEDREALDRVFRASMQRAGVYAHRYRVRQPDGRITHLHSQWAVKNGADGQPERVLGIMMDDTETMDAARARVDLESHFALAASLAGLVVWRHDLQTRRYHFNAEGLALLQLDPSADGIDESVVRALVHPDDMPGVLRAMDGALSGQGPTDSEARYRLRDGGWCHMLARRVLQTNERGEPLALLGVGLDITRRSEEARRHRTLSDRFELATRTAGIGYWSREGDAQRAYWSDQMRVLHGIGPTDLVPTLAEWHQRFVHPDDKPQVRDQFNQWLTGQAPRVHAELRITRTDGQIRHLLTHSLLERGGDVPVHFGIVIDVTDRRLADLALRRADQRAALAARGAGIGTWEQQWSDGAVHWDAQMWHLRGRIERPQAPTWEEILSFVHPDDRPQAKTMLDQSAIETYTLEHSFRVLWPDGSIRWLASRSTAVRDARGAVVRRIGVNWDVTAARQAEAERREREAVEQASRAKSQFMARMSHELRTPLNAVLGFTQLLQLDDRAPQRQERLEHIRSAGQHLLSLINDVLDLTSLDTGELRVDARPVPIAALIRETLPLVEPLRTTFNLTIHSQVTPLDVQADPLRLRQVLLNLLSNACKYNRPGGRVDVTTRAEGDEVVIAIADTGRGLDPEQVRQLFQPFNRLGIQREGIEGTGIGLAIVKALVERMQGRVEVRSQPGVGSVFEVRLPKARLPLNPDAGVLYIEDNPVNALLMSQLFSRRPDIRLLLAEDGTRGLTLARQDRPALVLLDMQLPDMDGLSVLQALRADPQTADIPCIAVSANAVPEDMARALAAGLSAYWTKPLDTAAVSSAIDALFLPPGVQPPAAGSASG